MVWKVKLIFFLQVFDDQTGAEPGWKGGEMGGVCGWFPEAYVEKAPEESSPAPAGPSVDTSSSLLSSGDSSFMTVPVKVPAVSPTPGQVCSQQDNPYNLND